MNRAELLLILADHVKRKVLTQAEATSLLVSFDAGEFTPSDLPDPAPTRDDWLIALLAVLLLVRGNTTARLPAAKRVRARTALRKGFEGDTLRLADGVANGTVTLQAWQTGVQAIVGQYARQMAVAGAGGLPTAATVAWVEAQLADQWRFLRRFAGVVGARAAVGRGLTPRAIGSRTRLYGAVGWAGYWLAAEESLTGFGQIVHFLPKDDKGTCSPCSQAGRNGPYLAGSNHPRPGSVCLGGGYCRCTLRFEYDPAVYLQLGGRP